MKVEIELEGMLKVASRGQTVDFDFERVAEDKRAGFFAHAALHGLKQAIADAAASATALSKTDGETRTPEEIAVDLMEKKCKAFESGEWAQRREAVASDPVGKKAAAIAFEWIKANTKLWEVYRGREAPGKAEMRKAVFEKYEDRLRAEAKKRIEQEAKLAEGLDLEELDI